MTKDQIGMLGNGSTHSNLQSFLDCTTPLVPPKMVAGKDTVGCFDLRDLWDCYSEWSAYGVGVPFRLHNGKSVTQYYAPSLSAIQIYTSKALASLGSGAEDTESEVSSEDSDISKLSSLCCATSGDCSSDRESSWLAKTKFGHLYFQFSESCSPYERMPLFDKIRELARSYPGLMSYNSVELLPASWMSVAWYPIYHIPDIKVMELNACFLTYHTISASFQDDKPECMQTYASNASALKSGEKTNHISLTPFGLETYKMPLSLWINPEAGDEVKMVSLLGAADSWLKQLGAHHHDFRFFRNHSKWVGTLLHL